MSLGLSNLLTGLASLAAVLILIVIAGRLATRMQAGRPRSGRRLQIDEILALDTKRRLVLVKCDGREALLLTGGPGDLLLGWLPGVAAP